MEAQLNSIISMTFLTSLRTWILKINFCIYICAVYIVKSLSFFRCEAAIFIIFPRKLVTSLLLMPLLFIGPLPRTGFTGTAFTSFYFVDSHCFILTPIWPLTKRCDVSNFKKSVASQLAKCLIFILRINDFLTTLSIIVAPIIIRYYFF